MISSERFKDFKAEHVLNALQLSFLETMLMYNGSGTKKIKYMTKKEFSDSYYGMTTLPFSLEVSELTVNRQTPEHFLINSFHLFFKGKKSYDDK